MTKLIQESSLESEEIEVNLCDNDDKHDNNIFICQIINRTINNDETYGAKQNMKRKWEWKQKWQK